VPITISKALINRLPETERVGLEKFLWAKSGGQCSLCGEPLNEAADAIEADHEEPTDAGGKDNRDNLNLVHVACNRAKRATPTIDVRPYLKLSAFIKKKGGFVQYGGCTPHFGIVPKCVGLELDGEAATVAMPDGTTKTVPILHESTDTGGERFPHVFVELPRDAIFNDDECQPRSIKLAQAWAIYMDIKANPLHEPPSCRVGTAEKGVTLRQLLMFDGQHKTIATWMHGRQRIVAKVYLDLTREQAIQLVNSIQAKIKKLPLSPFELSAKLADEWADKLHAYEEAASTAGDDPSEKGFIRWLPAEERNRGKQAFRAALVDEVLSHEQLRFLRYVKRAGSTSPPTPPPVQITENTFKTKVLEKLLHLDPLAEPADESSKLREHERTNIVEALNVLTDLAFEPADPGGDLTEAERDRMRRMSYQSALLYVAGLIKRIYNHELATTTLERAMLEKEPTEAQATKIKTAIKRIADHPVWAADLDLTQKLEQLREALSKNQDVGQLLPKCGLTPGYAVGVDPLTPDWAD
jgi:hypothetical protein